ncbi:MAG TPA: hypothetical protein VFG20_10605, partial [Planctomycetaceae bacterium]|nr:hypothetical protein [Planctomycetaceae bacterium]
TSRPQKAIGPGTNPMARQSRTQDRVGEVYQDSRGSLLGFLEIPVAITPELVSNRLGDGDYECNEHAADESGGQCKVVDAK